MGKSTISTGPFSIAMYVSLPEGINLQRGEESWDRKVAAGISTSDEAHPCFSHGSHSKFKTGKAPAWLQKRPSLVERC